MTPRVSRLALLAAVLAGAALPTGVRAQAADDVEMLGRVHGTRPPEAYYRLKAQRPDAFRFGRAWLRRNPRLRRVDPGGGVGVPTWEVRAAAGAGGAPTGGLRAGGPLSSIGPRDEPVTGTIRMPLVLGQFADSPETPPFDREEVQAEFFDGPNSRYRTISEFYDEISGGRIELVGESWGWVRSSLTGAQVAGGSSGLGGSSRVGEFIIQLLVALDDGTVDWGRYDNDGPDGVPNSGDDDGYVDVLAVMHPTRGSECGGDPNGNLVWSHKYSLEEATGQAYATSTASANGGPIRVSDYAIQPVLSCTQDAGGIPIINEIGVLAHELGHGFGLPDLYATGSTARHAGIGGWGLMGSGSWGCSQGEPARPCHMSAWSKAMLGWVDVETLPAGTDLGSLTLPPVETTGTVWRVDAEDGSGDYFLLENRQPTGFDLHLLAPGLLVWRIDEDQVLSRWIPNAVNNDRARMGVWLRQADGLDQLAEPGGGRGDAGDPFPGSTGKHAFHAGTVPSADTHLGEASGLTLLDVALTGEDVTFHGLTRASRVTVTLTGEVPAGSPLTVDGGAVAGASHTFEAWPFEEHVVRAAPGAMLGDGVRVGFAWDDDAALPRERALTVPPADAALAGTYGGRQVRLEVGIQGEAFGVPPGTVTLTPSRTAEADGYWMDEGTEVTLEAAALPGYRFVDWGGDMAGLGNPLFVDVSEPRSVDAVFELTYGVAGETTLSIEALQIQDIVLQAVNGTSPVSWSLTSGDLPYGMFFSATGRITGRALEAGTFQAEVRAVDDRGLQATALLTFEVAPPVFSVSLLTAPFLLQGGAPDLAQVQYLDRIGNRNGSYDVGDLRAYLRTEPDLPMTLEEREVVRTLVPLVRFEEGGER